ncbi:MAG: glycosyltransferase, partial [Burkholderiaceae bacterium]|nr:glycosyltransferase [Burkholderiaceae bacterium]
MLQFIGFAVLLGHYSLLLLLCIYGAHRLQLTWVAWRSRAPQAAKQLDDLPIITVQLPVFNERFVVERLIDAVAALDYPRERLQIQVLDDSTDDTTNLAAARVAHHRAAGIWIEHLHRTDRTGFKAGALGAGLLHAKGEFIAIFDADFVPAPEALKEAIHAFSAPDVGMVQLRWLHLNRHYNTLTEVQAVMLDAHFAIDQVARARTGLYFNFNGTAGLWRKQAIHDAGGWQWDTITEDLDLSYRAQMKGWRFVYLHNIGCPSELPVEMTAFKSQQHRWAQGAIQVMRKTLPRLWRAPLAWRIKLEATLHLSSNLAYLL